MKVKLNDLMAACTELEAGNTIEKRASIACLEVCLKASLDPNTEAQVRVLLAQKLIRFGLNNEANSLHFTLIGQQVLIDVYIVMGNDHQVQQSFKKALSESKGDPAWHATFLIKKAHYLSRFSPEVALLCLDEAQAYCSAQCLDTLLAKVLINKTEMGLDVKADFDSLYNKYPQDAYYISLKVWMIQLQTVAYLKDSRVKDALACLPLMHSLLESLPTDVPGISIPRLNVVGYLVSGLAFASSDGPKSTKFLENGLVLLNEYKLSHKDPSESRDYCIRLEVYFYRQLGHAHLGSGSLLQSTLYFKRYLELIQTSSNQSTFQDAVMMDYGLILQALGRTESALASFQKLALSTNKKMADFARFQMVLLGSYDLEFCKGESTWEKHLYALLSAFTNAHAGKFQQSKLYIQETLKMSDMVQSNQVKALSCALLSAICMDTVPDQAKKMASASLAISTKDSSLFIQIMSLSLLDQMGVTDSRLDTLKSALDSQIVSCQDFE